MYVFVYSNINIYYIYVHIYVHIYTSAPRHMVALAS